MQYSRTRASGGCRRPQCVPGGGHGAAAGGRLPGGRGSRSRSRRCHAQRLAAQSATSDEADAFTEIERVLIGALARGKTIGEIVEQVHYSDRTVRRRLQGLYVKLDVHSRGEAIEKIHLEGLANRHGQ